MAFASSKNWQNDGIHGKDQVELLETVKKSFLKYDYIDHIEIVPSTYLNGGEGFSTLEQVGRLGVFFASFGVRSANKKICLKKGSVLVRKLCDAN